MAETDKEGPGFAALRAHVDRVDGGPPRQQYYPRNPSRFQRGGPLHAVTVHSLEDPPHWHVVGYGLSELGAKESFDREVSGWGFELTFRLVRVDDEPPAWASDLLANLAAYVWQTGHDFVDGDHVDLRGPIRLGTDTLITAATVSLDPALGTLRGPLGRVNFLQVVGLTADELELCRAWRTGGVLALLAEANPLLVTDLQRPSLLDDPAVRERAEAGVASEASGSSQLRVGTLRSIRRGRRTPRVTLQLGAGAASGLGPALRRKLNRPGATFTVVGDVDRVEFVVADAPRWEARHGRVVVEIPMSGVEDLAGMFSGTTGAREVPGLSGLRFVILP